MLYVVMETLTFNNEINKEEYCTGTPLCASEFFLSTCNSLDNLNKFKGWKVSITTENDVLFIASSDNSNYKTKSFRSKLSNWVGGSKHDRSDRVQVLY